MEFYEGASKMIVKLNNFSKSITSEVKFDVLLY